MLGSAFSKAHAIGDFDGTTRRNVPMTFGTAVWLSGSAHFRPESGAVEPRRAAFRPVYGPKTGDNAVWPSLCGESRAHADRILQGRSIRRAPVAPQPWVRR